MEKPKGALQLLYSLLLLTSEMLCCNNTFEPSLEFCPVYNTTSNNISTANIYLAGVFNGMFLKFMKYNAG